MENKYAKIEDKTLAPRILELCRRQLAQEIPALMLPLYLFKEYPWDVPGPMATDGLHLFYCPRQVVEDFRADRQAPGRQMLHVLLHCLLGHLPQRRGRKRTALFDALVDWRVQLLMQELLKQEPQVPACETVNFAKPLPALYKKISADSHLVRKAVKLGQCSAVDDHRFWDPVVITVWKAGPGGDGEESTDSSAPGVAATSLGGNALDAGMENVPDWEGISRDLLDGQTFGKLPGALENALRPADNNQISYRQFLRRFAVSKEKLHIDPDGLDSRWYCLGLDLYGNIPLIEPPELSEPPQSDDLVIALDTSGSCSGEVMQRFLRETMNLLRDLSAGQSRFRILLLQCDARIQQEVVLEHPEQVETLLEDFVPKGFGGTDFRPVFSRVEQLRQEGRLPRVQGLLYLSDACGSFPDTPPDYPVAFLIPKEDRPLSFFWQPKIPPWITTLYLDTDEFTIKEASI